LSYTENTELTQAI